MPEIVLNTETVPSTPGAGVAKLYFDSVLEFLSSVDDGGIAWNYLPVFVVTTTADFTGTNVNTAQPVFAATEDTLTVPSDTSFLLEACYHIHTTGTTSHQLGLLFGGTATLTSIGYGANVTNAATEVTGATSALWIATAAVTNVTPATATATHHTCYLNGVVRINAGGTFIPQYQWSAAPGVAGVTLANSYLKLTPFGNKSRSAIGPWA